jgi:hypothetical protein
MRLDLWFSAMSEGQRPDVVRKFAGHGLNEYVLRGDASL